MNWCWWCPSGDPSWLGNSCIMGVVGVLLLLDNAAVTLINTITMIFWHYCHYCCLFTWEEQLLLWRDIGGSPPYHLFTSSHCKLLKVTSPREKQSFWIFYSVSELGSRQVINIRRQMSYYWWSVSFIITFENIRHDTEDGRIVKFRRLYF